MSDILELLELAALAYGIQNIPKDWRPDTDDGDSARLRSELLIEVRYGPDCVRCDERVGDSSVQFQRFTDHAGDRNAALRLATLRVAANIGRAIKEEWNG